jgi:hypothetical protein
LTGLFGEVVQHSNVVKSFSSYSARQHADQPLPDAHRRGILSQRSSAIGRVMPVAHRNARVKLDCEVRKFNVFNRLAFDPLRQKADL